MVSNAWTTVPRTSHRRVNGPTLSPMRQSDAPKLNARNDVSACWSLRWNLLSLCHNIPENTRDDATASYNEQGRQSLTRYRGNTVNKSLPVRNCRFGIHTIRRWRRTKRSHCKTISKRYYTGSYSQTSAHMKPVMKEKAAKGRVD
jgi:hypothetical protein